MNANTETLSLESTFHLYDSKCYEDCTDALMRYADRGNAEAQYRLALLFENGLWHDDHQPYIPAAMFYHYRAAAQKHVLAQVGLATLLEEFGCFNEAVVWWERAATAGHATARCVLGFRHLHGLGVPKSYARAISSTRMPIAEIRRRSFILA